MGSPVLRCQQTGRKCCTNKGRDGLSLRRRRRPNLAKARSSSTRWKSGSSPAPNGSRCTTKSGASSAISSTTRIITGWTVVGREGRLGTPGTFVFFANAHEPGDQRLLGATYVDAGFEQGKAALLGLARHPATATHVAVKLARHFVSLWEGGPNDEALIFLLRTAPTHQAASERMREIFAQQVRPGIGSLLGGGADGARRAGLAASQLLGLALCRYVLRLEPIASQDQEQLIADIAETIQRYLTGPLSPARPPDLG